MGGEKLIEREVATALERTGENEREREPGRGQTQSD